MKYLRNSRLQRHEISDREIDESVKKLREVMEDSKLKILDLGEFIDRVERETGCSMYVVDYEPSYVTDEVERDNLTIRVESAIDRLICKKVEIELNIDRISIMIVKPDTTENYIIILSWEVAEVESRENSDAQA